MIAVIIAGVIFMGYLQGIVAPAGGVFATILVVIGVVACCPLYASFGFRILKEEE